MTVAFPHRESADFRPRSAEELRHIRTRLIENLRPRSVEELKFLRSIDEITAEDEDILDTILALDFVIGDE